MRRRYPIAGWIGLLTIVLLQTACGFHLRGERQISPGLNPLHLQSGDLDAGQVGWISRRLQRAGADLRPNPEQANRLKLVFSPLDQQRIAGSGLSDVAVVRVSLSLVYRVTAPDGSEFLGSRLQQSLELQLDTNNVLAHQQQFQQAGRDLQEALVNAMLLQMTHFSN